MAHDKAYTFVAALLRRSKNRTATNLDHYAKRSGSAGLDAILDRHRIPQIGIMKLDPAAGVDVIKMTGDVIQRAPPAKHAVDFPICMPEKVIQEM